MNDKLEKVFIHKADCKEIKDTNRGKNCIVWPDREPIVSDELFLEYVSKDIADKRTQHAEEDALNLNNGRDYLMQVQPNDLTVGDALEAFGFGRNGLSF